MLLHRKIDTIPDEGNIVAKTVELADLRRGNADDFAYLRVPLETRGKPGDLDGPAVGGRAIHKTVVKYDAGPDNAVCICFWLEHRQRRALKIGHRVPPEVGTGYLAW